MFATHVVLRSIPGMDVHVGDEVDATHWRRTERWVDWRYLRPLNKDELRTNLTTRERIQVKEAARAASRAFLVVGAVPPEGAGSVVMHRADCECEDKAPEGWGVIETFEALTREDVAETVVSMLGDIGGLQFGDCFNAPQPPSVPVADNPLAKTSRRTLEASAKKGNKDAQAELERRDAAAAAKAEGKKRR